MWSRKLRSAGRASVASGTLSWPTSRGSNEGLSIIADDRRTKMLMSSSVQGRLSIWSALPPLAIVPGRRRTRTSSDSWQSPRAARKVTSVLATTRPEPLISLPTTPFQGSQCAIWDVEGPQHLSGLPTSRPSDRRRQRTSRKARGWFPSRRSRYAGCGQWATGPDRMAVWR